MSYQEIDSLFIGTLKANVYALWDLIRTNFLDHQERLNELDSTFVYSPVGTIILYSAASVPTGYLACDGSLVSRSTYQDLFQTIGTFYNSGDGVTTFGLPDFRGRTAVGSGAGSGLTARAIGDEIGEEKHALVSSEIPSHTHVLNDGAGHDHTWSNRDIAESHTGGATPLFDTRLAPRINGPNNGTSANLSGITVDNNGSGVGHENMQPWVAVQFLVKY